MSDKVSETTAVKDGPQPQDEPFVDALRDIFAAWAAQGLKVAKLALESSAVTLEKAAQALDRLADKIDPTKGDADVAAPMPTKPAEVAPAA